MSPVADSGLISSAITTHVLDTSRGQPAIGVPFLLSVRAESGEWVEVARGSTDKDGRARIATAPRGIYRLAFDTDAYFRAWNLEGFYPEVVVTFEIRDPSQHYHVPLLLSQYGYSTYRGS
jgi:5-hydroxyisourate hydrolase